MGKKLLFLSVFLSTFSISAKTLDDQFIYKEMEPKIPFYVNDPVDSYLRTIFSPDGKLFAISDMQSKKESRIRIRIYDSLSGELKYKTFIKDKDHLDSYIEIQFLPDGKSLFVNGLHHLRQFVWYFSEQKLVRACPGSMLGFIEDISKDNQMALYFTYDSYFIVCDLKRDAQEKIVTIGSGGVTKGGLVQILNYYDKAKNIEIKVVPKVNNFKVVLAKKRIMVLYGFGKENKKFNAAIGNEYLRNNDIDTWNINFYSNSTKIFTYNDKLRKRFIIFELFDNKTVVQQWDYLDKKYLGSDSFDFSADKVKVDGNKMFFLGLSNTISLVKFENSQLKHQWTKNISNELRDNIGYVESSSIFSSTRKLYTTKNDVLLQPDLLDEDANKKIQYFRDEKSNLATLLSLKSGEITNRIQLNLFDLKRVPVSFELSPLNNQLFRVSFSYGYDPTKDSEPDYYIYDVLKRKVFPLSRPIISTSRNGETYLTKNKNGSVSLWRKKHK